MTLVTYPCADCDMARMDKGTGFYECTSHQAPSCAEWDAVAWWEDVLYAFASEFRARKFHGVDDVDDFVNRQYADFAKQIDALGGKLDQTEFRKEFGVKP